MIRALIVSLALLWSSAWADLSSYFAHADRIFNIDRKILMTIAGIESNYNPYAIGILTRTYKAKKLIKRLAKMGVEYNIGYVKNGKMQVSISPVSYVQSKKVLELVKRYRIKNYDLGLMQINRVNIRSEAEEKALLASPHYNILKGAKILRGCFDGQRHNVERAIECYNKGFDLRGRRDYFKKFLKRYRKVAGL